MSLEWSIKDNRGVIKRAAKDAIFAALDEVGLHLQGEARDELENSPRRVDTGNLQRSITHRVEGNELLVGTNVEYAIYVHEGTRYMTPNQFLKNAFQRNMSQIEKYIINRLENW